MQTLDDMLNLKLLTAEQHSEIGGNSAVDASTPRRRNDLGSKPSNTPVSSRSE
jgi:hypothetical protein